MDKLIIKGGKKISGRLKVCGAKNAVLPILAATMLTDKTVVLFNCPEISDVDSMIDILCGMGCKVNKQGEKIIINTSHANTYIMPEAESKKMRSSIFMLGPLLARYSKVVAVYPGGCDIGARPIDLHLEGLKQMNVTVTESDGKIMCDGSNMKPANIHLKFPSVGATENLMMAAAYLDGITRIENAACEPEIVDLQMFMRELGINVTGAGTDVICVEGSNQTTEKEVEFEIMPDRIVAGTLLCAAAITGGNVLLDNANPNDLNSVLKVLEQMGCSIECNDNTIKLNAPSILKGIKKIETNPYPGFPTDMQALILALCCVADGKSEITENLYENRFRHIPELRKMGADIYLNDRTAILNGKKLYGSQVSACDLRAGAALIIAGLAADGTTVVSDVDKYVDRGYNHIETMLCRLGADIVRLEGE